MSASLLHSICGMPFLLFVLIWNMNSYLFICISFITLSETKNQMIGDLQSGFGYIFFSSCSSNFLSEPGIMSVCWFRFVLATEAISYSVPIILLQDLYSLLISHRIIRIISNFIYSKKSYQFSLQHERYDSHILKHLQFHGCFFLGSFHVGVFHDVVVDILVLRSDFILITAFA